MRVIKSAVFNTPARFAIPAKLATRASGARRASGVVIITSAVITLCAAACAAAPEVATVEQAIDDECPPSVCGTNAPGIDAYGFHSVSKSGQANEAGFRLVAFQKDGVEYQINVKNGYLSGVGTFPKRWIAGQDLVGAQLAFARDGDAPRAVRIARVGSMVFPVGSHDAIETYVLEYSAPGLGGWRNLCGEGDQTGVVGPDPEALGLPPDEAILFEGDHIDLVHKTVAVEPDPDWFTIGCSRHVLAKLHLTRNTLASTRSVPGVESFAGRQATLKLLTADYCGDGTAFTVAGQQLIWHSFSSAPPGMVEAYWNADGAVCLDTPRMAVPTSADGAFAFPDIEAAIAAHCPRPPPCAAVQEAERLSKNPLPLY